MMLCSALRYLKVHILAKQILTSQQGLHYCLFQFGRNNTLCRRTDLRSTRTPHFNNVRLKVNYEQNHRYQLAPKHWIYLHFESRLGKGCLDPNTSGFFLQQIHQCWHKQYLQH